LVAVVWLAGQPEPIPVVWEEPAHPTPATTIQARPDDIALSWELLLPGLERPLPLVHSDTMAEGVIQELLRTGGVVLPTGVNFGETGNVVVAAHSSGTTDFGPYRFAFAQLTDLALGDIVAVQSTHMTYRYRVYDIEIVWPSQVERLPQDETATLTLVTCWPLWTDYQRLLVHTRLVE
jgi:LPXTG-site transpeptidase (sortase) family protein